MADDKYARLLVDRARRMEIYRRINPCDVNLTDNCPTAAEAMFNFLNERPARAFCNEIGQGFSHAPNVRFHRAGLERIIRMVQDGPPGNNVVVHATRPPGTVVGGREMAPDHYFCLVRLGPPENDVFWADCSRPEFAMFFPSRGDTPGNFGDTIEGMARHNHLGHYEYTRGPFAVVPGPLPGRR